MERTVWIPNSKIASAPMMNLMDGNSRLDIGPFELAHGADLDHAREQMITALLHHAKVLPEPRPKMLVRDISQTCVSVIGRCFVEAQDQLEAPFLLREAVYRHLRANGVPFATWQPHVGQTLDAFSKLGYPGLEAGPAKPASGEMSEAANRTQPDDDEVGAVAVTTGVA